MENKQETIDTKETIDAQEAVAVTETKTEIKQLEQVGEYVRDGKITYLVASTKKEADTMFSALKVKAAEMGLSKEEVKKSVNDVIPTSLKMLKSKYNIEISRTITEEEKQTEMKEAYDEQMKMMKKAERRRLIDSGQSYLKGGFRLVKNFTAADRLKRKKRNLAQKVSRRANR
jgi:hypothetical protein